MSIYRKLEEFIVEEDGIATVWAVFWFGLCLSISGLAIDTTNAWKVKQILQTTADISAHAGALELGTVGNDSIVAVVRSASNNYASINMNPARYGDVLADSDIKVGYWDNDEKIFTELTAGSVEPATAVRVVTRQDGTTTTGVGTFFLRFIGFKEFTVAATATVQRFVGRCEGDGIFTSGENNASAQQIFKDGFCMHGETKLNFAQKNIFEPGTVASTPVLENCGPSPTSCTNEHNPGIEAALRSISYPNNKVTKIETYIAELQFANSEYQPEYIDQTQSIVRVNAKDFDASSIETGRIYVVNCSSGQNLDLGVSVNDSGNNGNSNGKGKGKGNSGDDIGVTSLIKSEFVLIGLDCDFVFDPSIRYEDAVFATTSTSRQSISGAAGVVLGKDDGCTPGGEVVAITAGSVHFSAKLEAYDVEFIIREDLHLASNGNADSTHIGSSFYVGGNARVTSKHTFAGCNGATAPSFDLRYSWRIVS